VSYRNFFASLLLCCCVSHLANAGVGQSATFTINSISVQGKVTAAAADGTLTITSNSDAVFTLVPQGDVVVVIFSGESTATAAKYSVRMNAAARKMLGLPHSGTVDVATTDLTATTPSMVAITVARIAAISSNDADASNTNAPTNASANTLHSKSSHLNILAKGHSGKFELEIPFAATPASAP
jgi:hypothetical protein